MLNPTLHSLRISQDHHISHTPRVPLYTFDKEASGLIVGMDMGIVKGTARIPAIDSEI